MNARLKPEHRESLKSLPLFKDVLFEFRDGWYELIYDLGRKITDYCTDNNIELPKILQIKEKFGSLRFYYVDNTEDLYIRDWVRDAEKMSEELCEVCGEHGSLLVSNGMWYTACENHVREGSMTVDEYRESMKNA